MWYCFLGFKNHAFPFLGGSGAFFASGPGTAASGPLNPNVVGLTCRVGTTAIASESSSGMPTPCRFLKPPKSAPNPAPKSAPPNSALPKPAETERSL